MFILDGIRQVALRQPNEPLQATNRDEVKKQEVVHLRQNIAMLNAQITALQKNIDVAQKALGRSTLSTGIDQVQDTSGIQGVNQRQVIRPDNLNASNPLRENIADPKERAQTGYAQIGVAASHLTQLNSNTQQQIVANFSNGKRSRGKDIKYGIASDAMKQANSGYDILLGIIGAVDTAVTTLQEKGLALYQGIKRDAVPVLGRRAVERLAAGRGSPLDSKNNRRLFSDIAKWDMAKEEIT